MILILPDVPDFGGHGGGENWVGDAVSGAAADIPYMKELYGELPENYVWMTLHQLGTFLKFNNYLNIQARSLIAAISFR